MLICTRIDNSLPQPQERNLLQQNQFQTTDVESYTIYIPTMLLKRQYAVVFASVEHRDFYFVLTCKESFTPMRINALSQQ